MHFTKMNVTQEQLEVMIAAIDAEYAYRNDYELAALISRQFQVNINNVLDTLLAYREYKVEDYEHISKKTIEYAKL